MKRKTRKLVFIAIAAMLTSVILTCKPFASGDYSPPEIENPSGVGSVTIYLDNSAPVSYSRALSLQLAILGHDFFEVAFYHPGSGVVARASWETGHAAGVSGVYRGVGGAGVSYEHVSASAVGGAGEGAAILFVGKKSDKTLLAIGRLTEVDGIATTVINADSKTVTFSVAALKAGVNSSAGSSSFKTNALSPGNPGGTVNATNTEILNVTIGVKPFPLFRLDAAAGGGVSVRGEYQFEVVSGDFDSLYRGGILLRSHTQSAIVVFPSTPSARIPRYPVGDNKWETSLTGFTVHDVDAVTGVSVTNNTGANTAFENPVQFLIGPTSSLMASRVFAFSFSIPVYPLTNQDSRASGDSWYLRPGYDSYLYDLDDGMGGTGGAILIGTGQFETSASSSLYIRKNPDKTRYNGAPWTFDITGIEVYLRIGGLIQDVTTPPSPGPSRLYYVIGGRAVTPGSDIEAILIANNVNGTVRVFVEYYVNIGTNGPPYDDSTGMPNPIYNGDPPYVAEFNIYYLPLPPGLSFSVPEGNRYVITNDEDWRRWRNDGIRTGNTYIIVFFQNFNIGDAITVPAGCNVIMLAGVRDIKIGKIATVTNAINDESTAVQRNIYYFGAWPFDEILSVGGMAIESQPFYINAGGTHEVVAIDPVTGVATAPAGNGWFINGGGANKIVYDAGVTILNKTTNFASP